MTATMDHTDATLSGAAERYILGEMNAEERERYEAHYFACSECADEVRAAARFVENARAALATAPGESPAAAPQVPRAAVPSRWATFVASFRPLPAGLAAAASLAIVALLAYQSLVVIPGLRQQVRDADGLQAAPSLFLSVARGEPPVIAVSPGERTVSVTLGAFDRKFSFYRVDLQGPGSRTIVSQALRTPTSGDELTVLVPVRGLDPGSYALVVSGLESESSSTAASDSARYPFRLERRDAAR